jgi:molecular chaperone DnaK (HSP70)
MEDTDVRGKITRDEFEEMTKPLLEKLLAITQKIIAQTGNPTVHSVELMGGASRIPAIENMMRENFPKPEGQEEEVLARSLPHSAGSSRTWLRSGCSTVQSIIQAL